MILNTHDKALLIALRKGKHFRANPGDPLLLLKSSFSDNEYQDAYASGRRLYADGYASSFRNDDQPEKMFLSITDSGMALADILLEQHRKRTLRERVAAVPRSDWIALLALLTAIIALFKGN